MVVATGTEPDGDADAEFDPSAGSPDAVIVTTGIHAALSHPPPLFAPPSPPTPEDCPSRAASANSTTCSNLSLPPSFDSTWGELRCRSTVVPRSLVGL